ncbi:MAG: tRNA pseudouridine(13) synthase TruD [Nanoarchaeota archaeon]|nr:tRNA pseudouridine(13) synthase TruD [Nanoarchaeota archaeon]
MDYLVMIELDKGSAVFKHKPEDFIVEEIWENYNCKVSESSKSLENAHTDFGKLDCDDRRDFLTCDLEKINIDHFTVFSILSKELHNFQHELGYAGTKDKIAWSCQRISIFNADIERIRNFLIPGIILKNFKWAKHKIKVGDLLGNRFKVILRDVDKDAIKILSRVRNTEYLPNFFGAQRFGSVRKENVIIGKLILKQKFQEAVFTYLTVFGDKESDEVKIAKKKLKAEKNLIKAKQYFPQELRLEHAILDHLSKNDKDWLGALNIIGEKTLLMMCQSVQSKIFNEILSRAIDERIDLKKISISIIGYNSNFSQGRMGEIEQDVLRDNNLEINNFKIPQIPFLSLKSSVRKAFFKVNELSIETEKDELFPLSKKIMLTFTLDSGTYATTFLEQFFTLR